MDSQELPWTSVPDSGYGARQVLSPGGWLVPAGKAGWDWVPPSGARRRLDRVPRSVRILYRTSFMDRYAHRWTWFRSGWTSILTGSPRERSTHRSTARPDRVVRRRAAST